MTGLTKLNQEQETWLNLDRIVHVSKLSSTQFKLIFDAGNSYSITLSEENMPEELKKLLGLTKAPAPKPRGRQKGKPVETQVKEEEEAKDVKEKTD